MAMQRQEPTRWMTAHGEVQATPDMLRELSHAPRATDFELYTFIQMCKAQGLNPFLREAYLIKYGDSPATIVTGKETFTQRAEAHPAFDGIETGVIVQRGDAVEYLTGGFHLDSDKLVGGWARVHRKDRKIPLEKSVAFTEYTTGRSLWNSKPATMIEKVAIVQALRDAFPTDFAGLYDSSEIGVEIPEDERSPITPARSEPAAGRPKTGAPQSYNADGEREFAHVGAFLTAAMQDLGMPRDRVLAVLGVEAPAGIGNLSAAWALLSEGGTDAPNQDEQTDADSSEERDEGEQEPETQYTEKGLPHRPVGE